YWQVNGTAAWHPETVPGAAAFGPPAITTNKFEIVDGVTLVAQQASGALHAYLNANGSGTWQAVDVHGAHIAASAPGATVNNDSENIAVFGLGGDLDFYWEDSLGHYQEEEVAGAAFS